MKRHPGVWRLILLLDLCVCVCVRRCMYCGGEKDLEGRWTKGVERHARGMELYTYRVRSRDLRLLK